MRQLGVPDDLVGVQRLVAITALAVDVKVGRKVALPREGDAGAAAVVEVPGGKIARSLQPVLGTCVGGPSVQREVEPAIAVAE